MMPSPNQLLSQLRNIKPNTSNVIISVILAWLLATLALFSDPGKMLEEHTFDLLSLATAPGKSQLPITIVGIDEPSFAQIGKRWPWPRDMHAKLVDKLSGAGAAVIAFDVIFSEPSNPQEDKAFTTAITKAGNVVLAADHSYHETAYSKQWLRTDPLPQFIAAGARPGLASFQLSNDTVARNFSLYDDALWRTAVQTLMQTRPGAIPAEPHVAPGSMIRHLGPAHTFPFVSYHQVLNGDPGIPADYFKDQIVLVGRDVRANPEVGTGQADIFSTPFLLTSNQLTTGVEIHATMIENALMGEAIVPVSHMQNLFILSCFMLLVGVSMWSWHPLRSALIVAILTISAIVASLWLFKHHHLWVATATPLAGGLAAMISMSLLSFFAERKRTQEIRNAFSMYVSRQVVDEIAANPEMLTLGGSRKEITVLFCDLAGFTSISEKLTPDEVGQVINLYLDAMTHVIMNNGGTVDKFIGDAIMAFWGAPLEDKLHARHAVKAAMEMQKTMIELQEKFATYGLNRVSMRIGIHSGQAVVGNMGSSLRFDYTALGDTVNLASRLEGVNKGYGTEILLSADTAKELEPDFLLRRVDRVRVKGKEFPVDIFTPCQDSALVTATGTAWNAYINRQWDTAINTWNSIQASIPDDPLAKVYLERITEFIETPPNKQWDGSIALEKF